MSEEKKQNTNNGSHGHHKHRYHHHRNKGHKPQQPDVNKQNESLGTTAENDSKRPISNENAQNSPARDHKKHHHKPHRNNQSNDKNDATPDKLTPAFSTKSEDESIFNSIRTDSFTAEKKRPTPPSDFSDVRQFSDEELFGTSHLINRKELSPEQSVEIVGIRFKSGGKIYYFAPDKLSLSSGDFAIVDTARGLEFGEVSLSNRCISNENIVQPLRKVIRKATKEDIAHNESNKQKEKEAFKIALEKIARHKLDMKLVDAQYSFDNTKLLFYFTSAGRVDFRELVRDLASVFKTRIELRQIGIRDEAKMLGGIGMCGRNLCCSKYLSNFAQVSIKMAKEQGLSLNSNKISGNCGRLMCCLNFENQVYLDEIKITPMPGSIVKVNGDKGVVTDANPLTGMLKVHLDNAPEGERVSVHRDSVTILSKKAPETSDNEQTGDTEEE